MNKKFEADPKINCSHPKHWQKEKNKASRNKEAVQSKAQIFIQVSFVF